MDDVIYALKKMKNAPPVLWDYAEHCCTILEQLYKGYGHQGKLNILSSKRNMLEKQRKIAMNEGVLFTVKRERNLCTFLTQSLVDFQNAILEVKTMVLHPTVLSQRIAVANFSRLYWAFLRMLFESSFALLQQANILSALEKIFKQHINVDKLIRCMEIPTNTMNFLSVGMFGSRFLLNLGIIGRHVFLPTKQENTPEISRWDRLAFEWKKRHADMLNHLAWMLINLVTNFRKLFHLSSVWAGGLTFFLISVDLVTLVYMRSQAEAEYQEKRSQYADEKEIIRKQLVDEKNQQNREILDKKMKMIELQMDSLEIRWKAEEKTINYFVVGTIFLMAAFGVMLVANPALVVLGSYVLGIVSASMFLAKEDFTEWKVNQLIFEYTDPKEDDYLQKEQMAKQSGNHYLTQMAKYTFVPGLILASGLIYWPIGLTLACSFVLYEIASSYYRHVTQDNSELVINEQQMITADNSSDEEEVGSDEDTPLLQ